MKLSWQKKRKKQKLNPASYIIDCNYLHNIHGGWSSLYIHITRLHKQHICMRFYNLANDICIVGIYILIHN